MRERVADHAATVEAMFVGVGDVDPAPLGTGKDIVGKMQIERVAGDRRRVARPDDERRLPVLPSGRLGAEDDETGLWVIQRASRSVLLAAEHIRLLGGSLSTGKEMEQ